MKTIICVALASLLGTTFIRTDHPTVSLVQVWPDNTITIHIVAGGKPLAPGIIVETIQNGVVLCDTYFDCPIDPYQWGNLLMGDPHNQCLLLCNTVYSFKVRSSSNLDWSNTIKVSAGACTSNPTLW